MKKILALTLTLLLCLSAVAGNPHMAIENGGKMEFSHAARTGKLSADQKAALELRLKTECSQPSNPITQGMIETRGPGKCLAFVRHQCACADCEMPTYCVPENER
jgi:hypothetical protein